MSSQLRLDAAFAANGNTTLDAKLWNTLLQTLEARFQPLEGQQASLLETQATLLQAGIDRLNEVLLPAAQKIFGILSSGFLIAHSSTSQTLVVGQQPSFVVPPGNERDLFVPSPYVTISRVANTTDYAFAKTAYYNADTGVFSCIILNVFGDPGPHTDWVIQDGTGVTEAVQQLYAAVVAAAAAAHTDRLAADADATATAADRAATHTDKLAADASAAAAASSATAAQGFAATVDNSTYAKKDGSTPFTGTQAGIAPAAGDRSTKLVTSAWTGTEIAAAIAALVNSAPGVLDTLSEFAAAIGNDPNFANTLAAALANRLRVDVAQSLGSGRQAQARSNLRVLSRGQTLALSIAN